MCYDGDRRNERGEKMFLFGILRPERVGYVTVSGVEERGKV